MIGPSGPVPIGPGVGLQGLQMAIDDLVDVARRMPTRSGETAASRTAAVPDGRGAFGRSPAGEDFEQMWALDASHHRKVVGELSEGLMALREALLVAAARTADAEAEAVATFASVASERSEALSVSSEAFARENQNGRAVELSAENGAGGGSFADPDTGGSAGHDGDAPVPGAPAGSEPVEGAAEAPQGSQSGFAQG